MSSESKPIKGAGFRKKLSFGKYSPRGKTEFFVCDNNMDLPKQLGDLECSMFEPPAKRSRPSPFQISQAVPKRFLKAYTHVPEEEMDTLSFFARIFPALLALLTSELGFHQYKVSLVLKVEMTKAQRDGKSKVQQPYFSSKPYTILSQHDIENAIEEAHQRIDSQIDKWKCQGSGWVVTRVLCIYVNIAKYAPLKGSSYIQLPHYLKSKKAIVNVLRVSLVTILVREMRLKLFEVDQALEMLRVPRVTLLAREMRWSTKVWRCCECH